MQTSSSSSSSITATTNWKIYDPFETNSRDSNYNDKKIDIERQPTTAGDCNYCPTTSANPTATTTNTNAANAGPSRDPSDDQDGNDATLRWTTRDATEDSKENKSMNNGSGDPLTQLISSTIGDIALDKTPIPSRQQTALEHID